MTRLSTVLTPCVGLMLAASISAQSQSTPPTHGTITIDSPGTSPHLKAFRQASTPGQVYAALNRYEGRYVLYVPCDGGAGPILTISRRTVYEYFADGPAATAVKRIQDRDGCRMYVTGAPGDTLKFYALDGEPKMTVLERTSEKDSTLRYTLLASAKNLRNYPVVKLHCITGRLREVEFEEIDFASLISQRRR